MTISTILAWTEESHQNDLKNGTIVFEENKDRLGRPSIYIKNMKSDAPRFGIACMRHIVSKSLELGMDGRVHNDASWSSHLFHLKMGMIPLNNNHSFVRHCFGGLSLRALQNYEMINLALSKGDSLLPDQTTTLNKIKKNSLCMETT